MSKLAKPIFGKNFNTKLGLNITFVILRNPWPHRVPDATLKEIIIDELWKRAGELAAMKRDSKIEQTAMGFALTDPTAPPYVSSLDAVMVIASVNSGEAMAVNAISKAISHRDSYLLDVEMQFSLESNDLGELLADEPLRLPDGAFGWNGSTYYKGVFGGASGASAKQDRELADLFARAVYDRSHQAASAWAEGRDRGWFCNQNEPDKAVAELAQMLNGDPDKNKPNPAFPPARREPVIAPGYRQR